MASLFKRGKGKHVPYTIQYTDHEGKRRTTKGFTDKGLTEQLAAKLESDARLRSTGLIDPEQERQLALKLTPLAELMPIFQESLASTGSHYRKYTVSRVEQLFAACGFVTLGDVRAESVQTALRDIQRAKNLSPKTYNNYQQSLHAFGQWCLGTKRLSANPLQGVERQNAELDIRRKRRALNADEVGAMIAAANASDQTVQGVAGPERARLYRLAYMTGLRRNELASLTKENFRLDHDPPTLTVEAAFSKHRRKDVLPLHPELVEFLKPWLATLHTEEPLFPKLAKRNTALMVKHDLETAGIPYITRDGVADFHAAGRHTYITELLRNGTSLPEAKELARHADISMTMRYTHIGLADQAKAIAKLPSPKVQLAMPSTSNGQPLAAPATDTPALHQRCIPSVAPRPALSHRVSAADTNPRDNTQPDKAFGTVCRKLSPHGTIPPVGAMPTALRGHGFPLSNVDSCPPKAVGMAHHFFVMTKH